MSKILIISEKPSVTKKVKEALAPNSKYTNGYYEDNNFVLTNCVGHLFELLMPHEINENLKKWDIKNLPFFFENQEIRVKKDTQDQFKIVKKLLERSDISEVVNCCDPDREGELIFRDVYTKSNPKCKNHSRMWTESVASSVAIKEAFDKRLKGSNYDNLYNSAIARRQADYHIGMNGTMAMTSKLGNGVLLSVGRVQTPTLKIVVDREREIENFKSETFYKVEAETNKKFSGFYIEDSKEAYRFKTENDADGFIKKLGTGTATIKSVTEKTRKQSPARLYNLSDLQVEMSSRYKYSAQQVLDACQSLYETHGLTTYPRTSENRISVELSNKLNVILKGLPSMFGNQVKTILTEGYTFAKSSIAKKDIGSHEALTPVPEKINEEKITKLSQVEKNVYMAIVERFLAQFYPDAIYNKQEIIFERNSKEFYASFENVIDYGHLKAYSDFKEQTKEAFIKLKDGDEIEITNLNKVEGKTQPPARFSEGSLIALMQDPSRLIDDKDSKKVLKETQGLGTEATRASIIEELKRKKFISVEKNKIYATELGKRLIDLAPDTIKSIDLTVLFETNLKEISAGNYDKKTFLNDINDFDIKLVKEINAQKQDSGINKNTMSGLCNCPNCSSPILSGKYGLFCSNKNCKVSLNETTFKRFGMKKPSEKMMVELLTNGITKKEYTLKSSKTGKEYQAKLKYSFDESAQYPNNIQIEFSNKK